MLWLDPDETAYAAHIAVWTRWFLWVGAMMSLAIQPTFTFPQSIPQSTPFVILHLAAVTLNGWVHYRLVSRRRVTWRHVFVLGVLDLTFVTATVVDGGYDTFWFVGYYAALAAFAAVFTSPLLNLTWTTITASIYVGVSLAVGSGMALDGVDVKALYVRVVGMFGVVLAINFITRFQRHRARAAMERERALQRERLELSETIHDTIAQTAFMIGLGIDAAKRVAGGSNEELTARLDATSQLSRTAVWQLRHPIDMGRIFEGSGLGWTLDSHVATYRTITSMSAELTQNGVEPPLSIEVRSMLFSIAHNALANALRHAGASHVLVELDFGRDELRLSVSDDGVGLPHNYEERGHGFANMRAYAERLDGRLIVEPRGPLGGASVTCVMSLGRGQQEG
ncbi:MAG: histidine kinase [Chloroflexi bacterium]|nr:histidine kinase [Chloroflexota bacterium]